MAMRMLNVHVGVFWKKGKRNLALVVELCYVIFVTIIVIRAKR